MGSGHTYERDAINKYMMTIAAKSPLTNQPMSSLVVVPNMLLRSEIREYADTHKQKAKTAEESLNQPESASSGADGDASAATEDAHAEDVSAGTAGLLPASHTASHVGEQHQAIEIDAEADDAAESAAETATAGQAESQTGGSSGAPPRSAIRRFFDNAATALGAPRSPPRQSGGQGQWTPLEE